MAHQGNPNQSPTLAHPLKEQPIDQGNKKLNVCEIVDDCNKLFEEAGQIMVMVNQWKEENNSDTTQPTDEQRRDLIRQLQTMISNAQSIQGKLKDNGLDSTTPSDNVEAAKTDENLSDELTDNSALSTAATQTENLTPKSTDSEPALSDNLEDEKPDDEDSLEADEESTDDKLQFSSPTAKAPSSANTEAQENAGESLAIKNDSSSNTVEQVRADDQVSDQVTDQSVSPTNQPVEPASFGNLEIEKTDMMDSSDVSNGIVERIERCKEAQMKDLQQILAKRKSLDPKNKTECERLDRSRKEGLALLEELDTMHTLEVIRTQDTERKQFVADATKSTNQKDKIKNSTVLERQLHNHRVGRELSSEIKKLQIPDDFLQKHTRYSTDMCRKARYGMTKSFGKKALLRFRNSITIFKQQQKEAGSPKKRATETDEELLIPTKKIRLEQVPVEGEQVPVEGEQVPVEGEQVPVEGEQVPVEGEQKEAPVVVDMPELFDDEPIEGLDQFRELQVQADYMKLSIHVILTMFLGAVDDIKTGKRKNTRQELCTPRIEEYIKHVSKHGKNYAQFNVNNYINEQKMNRTGKNFKKPIKELLYFFRDAKKRPNNSETRPNMNTLDIFFEGYERDFFFHVGCCIVKFWKKSLIIYAKFHDFVRNTVANTAIKNNLICWNKHVPNYQETKFFRDRRTAYQTASTETTHNWIMRKLYDLLATKITQCPAMDLDFDYMSTRPAGEVDQVEVDFLQSVFSTNFQDMRLNF